MIGVLIPARNEEALIGSCLRSVIAAAACPALSGEEVCVAIALDRCTDRTADIALELGVQVISLPVRNVGEARAAAAEHVLALGARWLATTDADTVVPRDWLSAQLAYDSDAFCGIVGVADWTGYADIVPTVFERRETSVDGHKHIHGANLGVSADFYRRAGGFPSLAVSEDVALVESLERLGARIARKPSPMVKTSARREFRATGGFGDYLQRLERAVLDGTLIDRSDPIVDPVA